MEIIFLGTGTSQGVPLIGCDCPVCQSKDPRDFRTRASVHVRCGGYAIQVDAGPDFRLQCLREKIRWIDQFILTHGHADHILGMDDLRRFIDFREGDPLPVWTTEEALEKLKAIYPYALMGRPVAKGYPAFAAQLAPREVRFPGGRILTTLLPHGSMEVLGLVFEEAETGQRLGYFTDCKDLPPEARKLAQTCHTVILDGLRPTPHPSHLSIGEACELSRLLGLQRVFLTHLTHGKTAIELENELPQGIQAAWDGLRLTI